VPNDVFGLVYWLSQNRFKFYTPDVILKRKKTRAITCDGASATSTNAVRDKGRSVSSWDISDSDSESESETATEISSAIKVTKPLLGKVILKVTEAETETKNRNRSRNGAENENRAETKTENEKEAENENGAETEIKKATTLGD
jgi:hypothetical protein